MDFLPYFQGLTRPSRHVTFPLTGLDPATRRTHPPSALPLALVRPKALQVLIATAPSQFATPNDTALLTANTLPASRFRRRNEPLPTLRTSTSHSHSESVGPHHPAGRIPSGHITANGSQSGRVTTCLLRPSGSRSGRRVDHRNVAAEVRCRRFRVCSAPTRGQVLENTNFSRQTIASALRTGRRFQHVTTLCRTPNSGRFFMAECGR